MVFYHRRGLVPHPDVNQGRLPPLPGSLRGIARIFPHLEDACASRYRIEDEAKGFRWGQIGAVSAGERKILERATEGPYEEFLEDRRRCPSPEEELAACSVELEWLAGAFGEVGENEVAGDCRQVAEGLFAGGRCCVVAKRQDYTRNHSHHWQE